MIETIVKTLEISTSHISKESKMWIDAGEDCLSLTIYEKHIYGWIILVPQDSEKIADLKKVPGSLYAVVK